MNRCTRLILLTSCFTLGCSSGLRSVRAATAEQLALPLEHRYVCASPNMMSVADGKIRANWPRASVEFRSGASGRVFIEDGKVVTNAWRDENGEHFFNSIGSGLGVETLIGEDNGQTKVVQLLWAPQQDDTEASVIETAADGTIRPRGVPSEVYSCLEENVVAAFQNDPKLANDVTVFSQLPLTVVGVEPAVPLSARPELIPLFIKSCSRTGEHGKFEFSHRGLETGPDYAWVPQEVLVAKASLVPAAISFGRRGLVGKDIPVFPVDNGGALFAIGHVRFNTRGVVDKKREWVDTQVVMRITADWQGGPELWCYFGDAN